MRINTLKTLVISNFSKYSITFVASQKTKQEEFKQFEQEEFKPINKIMDEIAQESKETIIKALMAHEDYKKEKKYKDHYLDSPEIMIADIETKFKLKYVGSTDAFSTAHTEQKKYSTHFISDLVTNIFELVKFTFKSTITEIEKNKSQQSRECITQAIQDEIKRFYQTKKEQEIQQQNQPIQQQNESIQQQNQSIQQQNESIQQQNESIQQ